MIVDDEPAVAQCLCYVLERPECMFATASNGKEALALIATNSFDIVITDHKMPVLCGLDMVRQLREQNYTGRIIVLSAHLSHDNIRAYRELAVDEILPKPFDSNHLRHTIANLAGLNGASEPD